MLDAIKQGNPLPLNLQLFDGKIDRVVKATVLGPTGAVINSAVVLTHSSGGLYQNNSTLMTLVDYVAVTYTVYAPDGVTEDLVYAKSQDVFYRATEQDASEIIGTVEDLNVITGTVEDLNVLTGEVEE